MKKKSLFKRLSSAAMALLLSLSALTQGITASAFSDTNKASQQWLNEWSYDFRGSGLPNGYDIETGKSNDTHFTGYWASSVPYFSTSDGSYAYCINFDKQHTSGTTSKQEKLEDYVKKAYVPDAMRRQIKEFTIYSYKGKTQYGYSKDTEICASSIMAQAVSARYYDESTTGLSSNETKLLNAYSYNGSNASSHHKELVDCYKKMKAEMLSHYDVPSGTSKASYGKPLDKASYPAKYDVKTGKWTAKLKLDSLSQFSVSKPNSVTVTRSGSDMTITADNEKDLKNVVFTLTKTKGKYVEHIDECSPLILSGGSDVQEMVVSCYEDKDPVKAYLKITTPIGSAHLDKSFTDYFDNKQTGTADMYKAVKFQLVCKIGDSYKFVKATGKDGSYSFTDLASQATDLTPNNKGDIDVTGLPEGDYEWREISTADGYMISSKKAITVTADKTAKTEFVNKASAPDKGKITIHKRDAETRADLEGAKFEVAAAEDIYVGNGYCIYPKGTVIDTITTGTDGIAETTKAIYKGYSYTVTEIQPPKGYSISDEPTQTIKLVEQQAEFVVDFENEQNTIPFEITKTDISTGELIPDCTFEILNENKEQVITGTTDENGIAHFQLAIGKYFYREISAPDIYEIDDTPYPFEITENDDIVKAEMTNKKKSGSIKVTKTTTGNLNIEGIKFFATGISDTNKDLKFEATTNENGVAMFDKLVIGKYVITEDGSTVPAAYLTADEQEVTVEYNETAEVAFENIEKTGSIVVHKTTEGQRNIEGIRFILSGVSDTGREIRIEAVTDKDGIATFENVPIGTYTITEDGSTVPYGYLVADEKEVKVEYAQTIDATILNNEQTGSIKVHKKTADMTNVEGIRFILSGVSDTGREIRIEAVTDKDGLAKFEGVPVGTYTITEDGSTVPYGYLVADSKQVTVTYAQTVDADMFNEKVPDTPNTGSSDNDIDGRTVLGGVVVILAGFAIVMFSRKRKER
ncbi:Predicted outer membrane protein [uncultured Ruminococcus sp.]|uniref:SpaA isopeptide-forming pilin-related protein n=3 Tax=Oscillospiraceae TaxID=216572 RepID=A0AAE3IID1_9FIRM|nr:SpaA isopeptide-forming pilin-related protein [Hominimerdicola aceti]MCU6706823.1 SpaA isopeptide-forming pilin-related protein [Hominimerdicola aceti]SCJ24935.1 Predicted outer membrane protein [uncultured Ruminococcus sp.]